MYSLATRKHILSWIVRALLLLFFSWILFQPGGSQKRYTLKSNLTLDEIERIGSSRSTEQQNTTGCIGTAEGSQKQQLERERLLKVGKKLDHWNPELAAQAYGRYLKKS